MGKEPHIGIITTSFPTAHGDPAGQFVYGLARALARRGYAIDVVAPEPAHLPDWRGDPPWLEGMRVWPAPYARPRRYQTLFYGAGVPDNLTRHPAKGLLVPTALAALVAVARFHARHWQAVMSHWLLPSALVAGMAKRGGARHLAIAHSADVHLLGRLPGHVPLGALLLRSADRLGFVSPALRDAFAALLTPSARSHFQRIAAITPMGVDLAALKPTHPRGTLRKKWAFKRFTVLFLGRLVPIKGLDLLIDALEGLDEFELIVAGYGPEEYRLKARASSRGIRARFIGMVDPSVRSELLAASDALGLPSRVLGYGRHAGLPLVLVEALGAGLPVIATRTGGVEDIIQHRQSGLTLEQENPLALRSALASLFGDDALRRKLKREGRAHAARREWRRLVPLFEHLLLA